MIKFIKSLFCKPNPKLEPHPLKPNYKIVERDYELFEERVDIEVLLRDNNVIKYSIYPTIQYFYEYERVSLVTGMYIFSSKTPDLEGIISFKPISVFPENFIKLQNGWLTYKDKSNCEHVINGQHILSIKSGLPYKTEEKTIFKVKELEKI